MVSKFLKNPYIEWVLCSSSASSTAEGWVNLSGEYCADCSTHNF